MRALGLLLLVLAGCDAGPPTPDSCRYVGVAVPDGTPMTGRIQAEQIAGEPEVKARCQKPFWHTRGCALAVDADTYVLWAVDRAALEHERCHARYQIRDHTTPQK